MRRTAALVVFLALLGVSCATGSEPEGNVAATPDEPDGETEGTPDSQDQPPPAELTKVTVGIIPISNMTPLYTADKLGFFADEGLEVETTAATQGAALVAAVTGGSLDFTYSNYISLLLAHAEGIDLVAFANMNSAASTVPDSGSIIVPAGGDVTSPEDIAGKRMGVSLLNALPWLYARAWLESHGVDPESVDYVEVPFPNMGDALANDQIDAALSVEPFNTILGGAGHIETIGHPYTEVQPGLNLAGWVSTREWVTDNTETARAFVRAIDRATDYLAANAEEKVALVAEYTESDPDLIRELVLDEWTTALDVDDLQAQADLAFKHGLLESELDASDVVVDVR